MADQGVKENKWLWLAAALLIDGGVLSLAGGVGFILVALGLGVAVYLGLRMGVRDIAWFALPIGALGVALIVGYIVA